MCTDVHHCAPLPPLCLESSTRARLHLEQSYSHVSPLSAWRCRLDATVGVYLTQPRSLERHLGACDRADMLF